jgi:hypothetical protein
MIFIVEKFHHFLKNILKQNIKSQIPCSLKKTHQEMNFFSPKDSPQITIVVYNMKGS